LKLADLVEKKTGGCKGITGFYWKRVGGDNRGDSRRRSEEGNQ
jgi:hypothetical protein